MFSDFIFSSPVFAASSGLLFWLAGIAVAVMVVFFGLVIPLAARYKRCPSNRVLVIFGRSGSGEASRCIHGGAAFIMPLIQDYAWLSLEPIQIEIPLRGALSAENIRVNVPSCLR
jgi:flotillin